MKRVTRRGTLELSSLDTMLIAIAALIFASQPVQRKTLRRMLAKGYSTLSTLNARATREILVQNEPVYEVWDSTEKVLETEEFDLAADEFNMLCELGYEDAFVVERHNGQGKVILNG